MEGVALAVPEDKVCLMPHWKSYRFLCYATVAFVIWGEHDSLVLML